MPSFKNSITATYPPNGSIRNVANAPSASKKNLLTTKGVATLTGLSTSYFEKGRIYGYGPKFIRLKSSGKTGKILYRLEAVEEWLASQEREPEVFSHGR